MEHEVVTEPRREDQLQEVISYLLAVLDPLRHVAFAHEDLAQIDDLACTRSGRGRPR